jgi:hypothetical protein
MVVTAFEDSTEDMVTKVLPVLQLLNLEGHPLTPGALQKFIAVRRLSGRHARAALTRRPMRVCVYTSTRTPHW